MSAREETMNREAGERINLVMSELAKESDRGSVIVGVACIDDELTRVLTRYLLPTLATSHGSDELFGPQGPLAAFSSRVDLAYRTGLLRRDLRQSLHLLRRLRNDFAHVPQQLSFQTRSVQDRVSEIFRLNDALLRVVTETVSKSERISSLPPEPRNEVVAAMQDRKALEHKMGTRYVFELTVALLVAGLVMIGHSLTPVTPDESD